MTRMPGQGLPGDGLAGAGLPSQGLPEPLGVSLSGDGVNVAVHSASAERIELCLFDATGAETARVNLPHRTGDVFHAHVPGIVAGQRYGLRALGPFEPERGLRFNPSKLLVDPYATLLDRPFDLHPSMFGYVAGDPSADLSLDGQDSAPFVPKAIVEASHAPVQAARRRVPWDRTLVYELHVRGFSQLNPAVPPELRGTFAGLGCAASVQYLAALGVTTVELMPVAAWVSERHLIPLGLSNAWGYNPITLLAPDPRLAPGGWPEVRAAVAALQAAGIEVIVDVVLNHTGEGDELGPTLSLRGLDNATYYRLRPDEPRRYIDDAGCGNTLALDRPPVLRLAMDGLRAWVDRAGIDGFRFDLATTMGRRAQGFDPAAPLLSAISQDPALRELKLIAEPWDIGPGGYQPGQFPAAWGEWNDRYRDDVRRFWRGDGGLAGALATRVSGSADVFGAKRRPSRSVNFIVAHDGFTLADLVSHAHKHNEANGENNRDGTDANQSWNNGVEGPTGDPDIVAARERDQRALLATLLLSRGTPMLAMGAESGHSQGGNNNAYAQDNEISWLDWGRADSSLVAFTAKLAGLRLNNPALRQDRFLTGEDRFLTGEAGASGFPDVEWRRPDGRPMEEGDWHAGGAQTLIAALCAEAPDGGVNRVVVVLHAGREPLDVVLPWTRPRHSWRLALDSTSDAPLPGDLLDGNDTLPVPARSVVLLVETEQSAWRPGSGTGKGITSAMLDRVARAAGIAPDWWDETGSFYAVPDSTKAALLAGMGVPASSMTDAREALEHFADERDRRALPCAFPAFENEAIPLKVGERGCGGASRVDIVVEPAAGPERQSGQALSFTVELSGRETRTGVDGRPVRAATAILPPLPAGRYAVRLASRPEEVCQLTVAPRRCYLPPALAGGGRMFGVAGHLYSVRREGDQGIGDFTTLGDLAAQSARTGAATLGINPLHALFAGDRERASPYHPSDRRFLDPIYLDIARLGDAANGVLRQNADAIKTLTKLRAIDYPGAWAIKRAALEHAFLSFEALAKASPRHPEILAFESFLGERGEALTRFCQFQAIEEIHPGPWQNWPADLQDANSPGLQSSVRPERVRFHSFLQWLCDRQIGQAAARGREAGLSLGLYCDLAVGAAPDGAEIWAARGDFARGVSIGAPPDLFSREGQVWTLPPPNPLVQARTGGSAFGALLAANMRHAGALRVDHAMGLTRLFWVPDGARGSEGAYVAAPMDHLMAQLALESTRARVAVIGEDLGTVPDGFRERLAAADVLSYRVLWFEREGRAFKPPEQWPEKAVACVSTHDLPTLEGWWRGADIAEKLALGLMTPQAAGEARDERRAEKRLLLSVLQEQGPLVSDAGWENAGDLDAPLDTAVLAAIHAYIASAPCALVLAQLDDLAGETDAVNLPGTDRERPNWRRRLVPSVETILRNEPARSIMEALRIARP